MFTKNIFIGHHDALHRQGVNLSSLSRGCHAEPSHFYTTLATSSCDTRCHTRVRVEISRLSAVVRGNSSIEPPELHISYHLSAGNTRDAVPASVDNDQSLGFISDTTRYHFIWFTFIREEED